jgi:hypothetical protein
MKFLAAGWGSLASALLLGAVQAANGQVIIGHADLQSVERDRPEESVGLEMAKDLALGESRAAVMVFDSCPASIRKSEVLQWLRLSGLMWCDVSAGLKYMDELVQTTFRDKEAFLGGCASYLFRRGSFPRDEALAMRLYARCAALPDRSSFALSTLAHIDYGCGRKGKAVAELREAVKLAGTEAQTDQRSKWLMQGVLRSWEEHQKGN